MAMIIKYPGPVVVGIAQTGAPDNAAFKGWNNHATKYNSKNCRNRSSIAARDFAGDMLAARISFVVECTHERKEVRGTGVTQAGRDKRA